MRDGVRFLEVVYPFYRLLPLMSSVFTIFLLLVFSVTGCSLEIERPNGHALIYGISEYTIAPDLRFTDDDARAMAYFFEDAGYSVTLRLNYDATKEQLAADIATISSEIGDDENFVFYFSGHGGRHIDFFGTYSDQRGNESVDSDNDDEWIFLYGSLVSWRFEDWPDTAVSDDELGVLLDQLPTKRRLVLIDACNSGGFIGDAPALDIAPGDYSDEGEPLSFQKLLAFYSDFPTGDSFDVTSEQAIVLAAAGEREESWENSGIGHGIFTYFFLQSRESGDLDGNGFVSIMEVYTYVCDRIEEEWNNEQGEPYIFLPHITGTSIDFLLFESSA